MRRTSPAYSYDTASLCMTLWVIAWKPNAKNLACRRKCLFLTCIVSSNWAATCRLLPNNLRQREMLFERSRESYSFRDFKRALTRRQPQSKSHATKQQFLSALKFWMLWLFRGNNYIRSREPREILPTRLNWLMHQVCVCVCTSNSHKSVFLTPEWPWNWRWAAHAK
jgi:hypothetical protein